MTRLTIPDPTVHESAFIAPGVEMHGRVFIGPQAVVMFGTVIRAELDTVSIGRETNIQDNCVLHADEGIPCALGARVTVGHAAVVHGATIGDRCLLGIGAVALNGSSLGEGAWLGAGSVLMEGQAVPPWTLAVGTPARPLRDLTPDEVDRQVDGVDTYLRYAAAYRTRLP